jgi:drug/metabolite transporter (DMT)-like permease
MYKKAHLAGILFSTIFGFSFMFSKIAMTYVTPVGLIAYRFLVAIIAFELLRLFKIVKIRFDKSLFKPLLYVVIFQPILYFIFETYGLFLSTSGEAGMMIALIPIFVTIFSALILKEKPSKVQVLFILLSVSGVMLIQLSKTTEGLFTEMLGFLLLLGAVLSAAMFNIASRSASKNATPYEVTYFMMLSGAIAFNVLYIIQLVLNQSLTDYLIIFKEINLLLPILYLGIVASIGGFFLVNLALYLLPAHVTSIYSNIATIVAIIAGATLLNEDIFLYHIIGSLMIIAGVYGTVRFSKHKQRVKKIKI